MSWNKIDALAAACPECNTVKTFTITPQVGQIFTCAQCATKMEVAYLRPIMLDYADEPPNGYKTVLADEFDYDD